MKVTIISCKMNVVTFSSNSFHGSVFYDSLEKHIDILWSITFG